MELNNTFNFYDAHKLRSVNREALKIGHTLAILTATPVQTDAALKNKSKLIVHLIYLLFYIIF